MHEFIVPALAMITMASFAGFYWSSIERGVDEVQLNGDDTLCPARSSRRRRVHPAKASKMGFSETLTPARGRDEVMRVMVRTLTASALGGLRLSVAQCR